MQNVQSRTHTFTMVELMIVVVIVALLAAAAVPFYQSGTERARLTEVTAGLGTVRTAQRVYKAEYNAYPQDSTGASKAVLEDAGYLSSNDFQDMAYVAYNEFSVNAGGESQWDDSASAGYDFDNYSTVTLSADGNFQY